MISWLFEMYDKTCWDILSLSTNIMKLEYANLRVDVE